MTTTVESISLATRASYLAVADQAVQGAAKHLAYLYGYVDALEEALEDLNPGGTKADLATQARDLLRQVEAQLHAANDYLEA